MDHFSCRNTNKMARSHVVVGSRPCCFFCAMEEKDPCVRKAWLELSLRDMHMTRDDTELALTLSFIWRYAMADPENPELPTLGVFECMTRLMKKGLEDVEWVMTGQNVFVPYYAAHIIGSYTMKNPEFAAKAVESGVIAPLLELMRGKMSWVEQRVVVRALGHLASYETTFEAVAAYENEVVRLAMEIATTCVDVVYEEFVSVKEKEGRVRYHSDLLTRGLGGLEMEDRKAEEWASQLQCWSLHLLNCFAYKQRCISLICNKTFLKELSQMWGGLVNHTSPAGIGLIRIICYSKQGRRHVSGSREMILSLCNLSRSSDDWQYMGIDCLLLLLKDQDTRYKVLEMSLFYLVDLVELKALNVRPNLGDRITKVLLMHYHTNKGCGYSHKAQKALKELWRNKVERRKRERKFMSKNQEFLTETSVVVNLIKQQANQLLCVGDIEGAIRCYNEAIGLCPLKLRRKRMILYSQRGECYLLFGDVDAAISDCTRALCLSEPVNSHGKSLWTRSRAYDIKGLSRESLMDCIMFVNGRCFRGNIPYHATQMISKQMEATWLFEEARASKLRRMMHKEKYHLTGLSTITEEPGKKKEGMMVQRKKLDLLD
ncbi:Tetratricopeptide repeat [Arabidopsis thaliana x Arabidopsis arenosa]|uniref:Tetratricopeptide repeat n=1 Tax=Arabidopsis thaliana x Arabidopsis arenosa TaxID=1240361 RepID=A0A8T1XKZ8_9BRAS|nr:Tetratricopeptide repeat [Arabidopsis thaliana x Arabidopsis arenosa]